MSDTTITHIRGDNKNLRFTFTDKDGQVITDIATVAFSVRKDYDSKVYLLTKTATMGMVSIVPADTMGATAGDYVYDVQLTMTDGKIFTPLVGKFILLPDVTR